jgi:hypothetical protein
VFVLRASGLPDHFQVDAFVISLSIPCFACALDLTQNFNIPGETGCFLRFFMSLFVAQAAKK